MKKKFRFILYGMAILAVIGAVALMFRGKTVDTTVIPLFVLGLVALLLPSWADSIRGDIDTVTTQEADYYIMHMIKGKYIIKNGDGFIGLVIGRGATFKHFEKKKDCHKWLIWRYEVYQNIEKAEESGNSTAK